MTLTLAQARDAVIGVVETAWTAIGSPSEDVPLHYDGTKQDRPTDGAAATKASSWARVTVRTIASPQAAQGRRRYQTTSSLTVQIFTPIGDGWTLADTLAQVVLDALRGHAGSADGLWFFDITPNEIGVDGPWLQMNVEASFRYQEIST